MYEETASKGKIIQKNAVHHRNTTYANCDRKLLQAFSLKTFQFLDRKPNEADTSKPKFAAMETFLESKKKQTLPLVFPRVKLATKFIDFLLSKIQNFPKNYSPVLVEFKIPASGDFLETFENVDDLFLVLVSNQVSSNSQPIQNVPSRIL